MLKSEYSRFHVILWKAKKSMDKRTSDYIQFDLEIASQVLF